MHRMAGTLSRTWTWTAVVFCLVCSSSGLFVPDIENSMLQRLGSVSSSPESVVVTSCKPGVLSSFPHIRRGKAPLVH